MVFNANVELDTNIHNTPSYVRNMILDCYSNVFQSLIISTNYSLHFRYLSHVINSNSVCSFFKYNHLPHLLVVADRHSLEIIKYSNRGHYGRIRLLVTHSQLQNVPQFFYTDTANTFRFTLNALIFEQDGEILVLDVKSWDLIYTVTQKCIAHPFKDV